MHPEGCTGRFKDPCSEPCQWFIQTIFLQMISGRGFFVRDELYKGIRNTIGALFVTIAIIITITTITIVAAITLEPQGHGPADRPKSAGWHGAGPKLLTGLGVQGLRGLGFAEFAIGLGAQPCNISFPDTPTNGGFQRTVWSQSWAISLGSAIN